jgi:hypothetical protein
VRGFVRVGTWDDSGSCCEKLRRLGVRMEAVELMIFEFSTNPKSIYMVNRYRLCVVHNSSPIVLTIHFR